MYFIRQGDQIRFMIGLYQGRREAAFIVQVVSGWGFLAEKADKLANNSR
jgi:hypothetical protein